MNFLSELFTQRPSSWGLRGDPFLWDDLEEYFSSVQVPESEEAFQTAFYQAFFGLTGVRLESTKDVFLGKYDQGGMSSGWICASYWKNELFPLLLTRFKAMSR